MQYWSLCFQKLMSLISYQPAVFLKVKMGLFPPRHFQWFHTTYWVVNNVSIPNRLSIIWLSTLVPTMFLHSQRAPATGDHQSMPKHALNLNPTHSSRLSVNANTLRSLHLSCQWKVIPLSLKFLSPCMKIVVELFYLLYRYYYRGICIISFTTDCRFCGYKNLIHPCLPQSSVDSRCSNGCSELKWIWQFT